MLVVMDLAEEQGPGVGIKVTPFILVLKNQKTFFKTPENLFLYKLSLTEAAP